jgi:hypothetical protein
LRARIDADGHVTQDVLQFDLHSKQPLQQEVTAQLFSLRPPPEQRWGDERGTLAKITEDFRTTEEVLIEVSEGFATNAARSQIRPLNATISPQSD